MLAGSEGIGGIAFDDYRFAFRLGVAGAGAHPVRRRAQHPARRGAAGLGAGGPARPRSAWLLTAVLIAVAAHALGPRLAGGAGARRGGVVHRRGGGVRGAPGQRAPAQAAGGRHARGRVRPQRSGRRHPHHHAHRRTCCTRGAVAARGSRLEIAAPARHRAPRSASASGYGGRHAAPAAPARRPAGSTRRSRWRSRCWPSGWRRWLHGSGFLAVYLAGMVLGNGPLPYRAGLLRVHDALAWLSQIGMFLILGLLVFPPGCSRWPASGSAWRCCSRSWSGRWWWRSACRRSAIPAREVLYIGWVGLRGAVPIVLATFPVLVGRARARTGSSTWCSSSWW